jgi:glycerol-3-phosphate acyltransferase PlsY
MFSYWIARLKGINLKKVREGNPGAFNLGYSLGLFYGILGASLDFLKGYIPIMFILKNYDISSNNLIIVALSPILGHAFSPFLKFKGGKALAVTFGVWSALTKFKISFIYAVILGILKYLERNINEDNPSIPEVDAALDLTGFGILGIFLWLLNYNPVFLKFWFFNLLLLIFKRYRDLISLIYIFSKKMRNSRI